MVGSNIYRLIQYLLNSCLMSYLTAASYRNIIAGRLLLFILGSTYGIVLNNERSHFYNDPH